MPTKPSADVAHALDLAADKHGLPRELLHALAYVESRYNPEAQSPRGAVGLLQLMPETADNLEVDPWDPAQNADGGARFLAALVRKYGGDVRKALAAYNWGPGNVDASGGSWPQSVFDYVQAVVDRYDAAVVGPAFTITVPVYLKSPVEVFFARMLQPVRVW